MFLGEQRLRLTLIGVGLIVLAAYLTSGSTFAPPPRGTVEIEFGMYPTLFEGLPVEIDGREVGRLRTEDRASRSRFEVAEGLHRVRVVHPRFETLPARVDVKAARPVVLVLDLVQPSGAGRPPRTIVSFRD